MWEVNQREKNENLSLNDKLTNVLGKVTLIQVVQEYTWHNPANYKCSHR